MAKYPSCGNPAFLRAHLRRFPGESKSFESMRDTLHSGTLQIMLRFDAMFGSVCLLWIINRSEEHTSELQSLMRISYAVFCLKKKNSLHHQLKHSYSAITQPNHLPIKIRIRITK